jgi:hypothetical protein
MGAAPQPAQQQLLLLLLPRQKAQQRLPSWAVTRPAVPTRPPQLQTLVQEQQQWWRQALLPRALGTQVRGCMVVASATFAAHCGVGDVQWFTPDSQAMQLFNFLG